MTCTIFRGYEFGDKRLTDRVIASKQQSRYASECQQSENWCVSKCCIRPVFQRQEGCAEKCDECKTKHRACKEPASAKMISKPAENYRPNRKSEEIEACKCAHLPGGKPRDHQDQERSGSR